MIWSTIRIITFILEYYTYISILRQRVTVQRSGKVVKIYFKGIFFENDTGIKANVFLLLFNVYRRSIYTFPH